MRRFGLAAVLLVLILALAPTIEATTTWTARPAGRGTATLRVGSPSRLTLALTGFRAGSTWTLALRRGSCARLGTLVASVKVKATSTGRLSKTVALTTTQTRAARLPLTLRFGTSCVAFAAAGSGSGPSGNPWTGSAGPWPGRQLFTYPENEDSAIVGVAPDGTIYTHGYVSPTAYSDAIRSFQPDGTPSPGWPADGVLLAGFFQDAVLAPGGGLYVSMESPPAAGSTGTGPHATTITALDATGKVKPGWPVVRPMTILEPHIALGGEFLGHGLVGRPAGGVCFVEEIGLSMVTAATWSVTCLGVDGRPVAGWSYHPPMILGSPAFGPDGTLYVDEASLDATGQPQARIMALGPDGQPVAGWAPVKVPLATVTCQILVRQGVIYILAKPYPATPLLIAVDSHGLPIESFAANTAAILDSLGSTAYPDRAELGPDGTLYFSVFLDVLSGPSLPDTILAIGPDGKMRPGWPFRPGSLFLRVQPGPDGAIWVWMADGGAHVSRLAVLGANGAVLPGWPVLLPFVLDTIAFDRQGRPFFIARPYGRDYLETIAHSQP